MGDKKDTKIVVVVGGCGTGKTSLVEKVIEDYLNDVPFELEDSCENKVAKKLVTHTTRKPRVEDGEVDGEDYHFVSKEEFDELELIEETKRSNSKYGLSKKELEESIYKYEYLFIVMDRYGLKSLKEEYPEKTTGIYIYSDPEAAKKRMEKRGDSEEKIEKRINQAIREKEFNINYMLQDMGYMIWNKEGEFQLSNEIFIKIIEKL